MTAPEDVVEPTAFRVEVRTDNAAFLPDVVPEVARMLHELADRLLMEHERFTPGVSGTSRDVNGSIVLEWTWDRVADVHLADALVGMSKRTLCGRPWPALQMPFLETPAIEITNRVARTTCPECLDRWRS